MGNNKQAVRWSDKPEELANELTNIVDMLCNYAYDLNNKGNNVARDGVQSVIFNACNHLDRIQEDLRRLPGRSTPQTLTEEVRTIKTLHL